jgi:acyl dehydratase
MSELWHYEDFALGQSGEHGPYEVTAAEIKDFAQRWDPQPFHLDEEAGRASLMGALCASGWHVCAMMNRLMIDGYVNRSASMGSFGLSEVRWAKPVFPGDRLSLRWAVTDKRISSRRPEMGIITMHFELSDHNGQLKLMADGVNLLRVRGHPA